MPRPTVTITGKSVVRRGPTRASLTVPVEQVATDRKEAWDSFQATINTLTQLAAGLADLSGLVPAETKREKTDGRRQVEETVVTATPKLEFPIEAFGAVITALVNAELSFGTLTYTQSDDKEVSQDQLVAATSDARNRALAIATAAQGRLGDLVSVEVGSPATKAFIDRTIELFERPDWGFAPQLRLQMRRWKSVPLFGTKDDEPVEPVSPVDFSMLQLATTDVPISVVTAYVTLTYQVLPAEQPELTHQLELAV
jgi:hypothetical protein